jgi:hypothetical protein
MALALLRSTDPSSEQRIRKQVTRLLKLAERIAVNENDGELHDRVRWVKTQMEENHVVQKNE